jgi:hypothetical protein
MLTPFVVDIVHVNTAKFLAGIAMKVQLIWQLNGSRAEVVATHWPRTSLRDKGVKSSCYLAIAAALKIESSYSFAMPTTLRVVFDLIVFFL